MLEHKSSSYFLLFLAQLCYSVNVIISKEAISMIPVYSLCGLRYGMSSFFFLIFCLIRKPYLTHPCHPQKSLTKSDWLYLVGQGLAGGFIFNVLFYRGLKFTTATSAGIISASLPAFIAVFAFLLLKEHISFKKQIAILLSMIGIMSLSIDDSYHPSLTGSLQGDGLVLLAIIPEALYSIFSSKTKNRVGSLAAATFANMLTAVLFIPMIIMEFPETLKGFTPQVGKMVFIGGISGFLFFWSWSTALQTVPASTAGLFGGLLPVLTAIMAIFFLGETLSITDGLGMFLVIFSIFFGVDSSKKRP